MDVLLRVGLLAVLISGCSLLSDPIPDRWRRAGISEIDGHAVVEMYLCEGESGSVEVIVLDSENDLARDGEVVFRTGDDFRGPGWVRVTVGEPDESYTVEVDRFEPSQAAYLVAELVPVTEDGPITNTVLLDDLPDGTSRVLRTGGAGEVGRSTFESEAEEAC